MTNGVQHVSLPSRAQVNDYLVSHVSAPEGLYSGWQIDGRRFDIYALMLTVLQMGGSSEVRFMDSQSMPTRNGTDRQVGVHAGQLAFGRWLDRSPP